MSHTIHTTDGFILKSADFGEANRYYYILTREFGLIRAAAQGIRLIHSKLRYGLEDFSLARISAVRGREIWRLTGAEKKIVLPDPADDKKKLAARFSSLLLRLLHGEERNDRLFAFVEEGLKFLAVSDLSADQLADFECLMALRILSALGYIGELPDLGRFTESPYFTAELLSSLSGLRLRAVAEINRSLKETHL